MFFQIWFSQQPLVGSYSNLKLKLLGLNQSVQRFQMKMTSNGRRPPTEDDLKKWKGEYLSNHWQDLTQILKSRYWDQTKVEKGVKWRQPPMEDDLHWKMISNGRWPPMEDDLKIWKVEYLSNHWLDPTQIWNLSYWDQIEEQKGIKWKTTSNERWPQNMKRKISQQPLTGSYSNLKLKL
jgi:hypothetical protein